jgi:motility quorum-sensing regulator/GCU-specific mRNA interferase toxin
VEKKKPHYELLALQVDVSRMGQAAFTGSALAGGYRLGLSLTQMLNVIASLKRSDFYKSMTTHGDSRRWQDVYRPSIADGVELYVKMTYQADNGPPVISFKER